MHGTSALRACRIDLPTLFVAHRFDALQVVVTNARLAVHHRVPFQPATASAGGLIPMGRKKKSAQ